jgi:DNA-binding GntR family transcriptional regulator
MESGTQTEKTFQNLLEAIVKGDIPPGTRLRETDIAREMGIGRGPLREALQRLESRKLVTKVPHVGAQVANLELKELIEIYQLRETLEGLACELAAQNLTDDELVQLGVLLEAHSRHVTQTDGRSYIDQDPDLDFHFQIIQASNNDWLIRLLCDELYHRVRMFRYQSSHHRSRPEIALDEHQRIYQALLNRDGELASLLMRRHISAARKSLEVQITAPTTGEQ